MDGRGRQRTGSRDLISLLVAAALVNLVFVNRYDWAAHMIVGGAIPIAVAAGLPRSRHAWASSIGVVAALGAGVIADLTVTGPWDPSDVAFTAAGALIVVGEHAAAGTPPARTARAGGVLALAMVLCAFGFRYGIRRGP